MSRAETVGGIVVWVVLDFWNVLRDVLDEMNEGLCAKGEDAIDVPEGIDENGCVASWMGSVAANYWREDAVGSGRFCARADVFVSSAVSWDDRYEVA